MRRHGLAVVFVCIGLWLIPGFLTAAFSQEFGPEARNSYVVKFLDPTGPLPTIGGVFDSGWKATFNESTKWLIYTDPETDQDPVNGPRSDDFHFYAGILDGTPPRLFVGINGVGFTPNVGADAPTENDAATWWGSSLYEMQIVQNFDTDPRNKISIGYDGHWSDFQRSPEVGPADFTLTNLEVAVIDTGDGFAAELAFDLDENAFLTLDSPDPATGITWLRVIISHQGSGVPLVVWPDGDFNGNVGYATHGSTGWDHFGWWDVTSARSQKVKYQAGVDVSQWEIH
ncbi:MAG: hypothetical protein ACE15F_13035 [bacterium]